MARLALLAWALFYRLPFLALSAIYFALAAIAPSQFVHVLRQASNQPTFISVTVVVPSIAIAITLAVFLRGTERKITLLDAAILSAPTMALTVAMHQTAGTNASGTIILALGTVATFASVVLAARFWQPLYWRALSLSSAILAGCIYFTFVAPVDFPRAIGPLGITILGLGLIAIGFAALQINRTIGLLLLAAFLGSAIAYRPTYPIRNMATPPGARTVPLYIADALGEWVDSRRDSEMYKSSHRPYPVFIVSAAGGGISAAALTYQTMAGLDAYCPRFLQHMFASIGVSGGSVGLAMYGASLANREQRPASEKCGATGPTAVGTSLTGDNLSPILGAMFFKETVELLLPFRIYDHDAAAALELALVSNAGNATSGASNFLNSNAVSWTPNSATPALAFAATRVSTGTPFLISPIAPYWSVRNADWLGDILNPTEAPPRVVTAAVVSARFPWIAPSAQLLLSSKQTRLLVDGGYYDNSGAEAALELYLSIISNASIHNRCLLGVTDCLIPPALRGKDTCRIIIENTPDANSEWVGCDRHIFLSFVSIQYQNAKLRNRNDPNSRPWDPLTTAAQGMGVRAAMAADRLDDIICALSRCLERSAQVQSPGYFRFEPDASKLDLPFGWNISPASVELISSVVASPQLCNDRTAMMDFNGLGNMRSRFGCEIRRVGRLIEQEKQTLDDFPIFLPLLPQ